MDIISEEQALQLQSSDALVVRAHRGAGAWGLWLFLCAFSAAGFSLSYWQPYAPWARKLDTAPVFLFAALSAYASIRMALEFWAISRPSNWFIIYSPNQVMVKLRTFRAWRANPADKVVLRFSPLDIDHVQPIDGCKSVYAGKNKQRIMRVPMLDICLKEAMPQQARELIKQAAKKYGSFIWSDMFGCTLGFDCTNKTPAPKLLLAEMSKRCMVKPEIQLSESDTFAQQRGFSGKNREHLQAMANVTTTGEAVAIMKEALGDRPAVRPDESPLSREDMMRRLEAIVKKTDGH